MIAPGTRKLGKHDPRSIRIEQRITHEELAAMVGTTRLRISTFIRRFLDLGLIEWNAERFLIGMAYRRVDHKFLHSVQNWTEIYFKAL